MYVVAKMQTAKVAFFVEEYQEDKEDKVKHNA